MAIDFGSGPWQRILEIRDSRNDYAHSGVSIANRFPTLSIAENAIAKIREAIPRYLHKVRETNPGLGKVQC